MSKKKPGLRLAGLIVGMGAVVASGIVLKKYFFTSDAAPTISVPASPLASDVKSVHPLRAALNNKNWQEWVETYKKSGSISKTDSKTDSKSEHFRNLEKEEAIKILNSFLDSGFTLPAEGLVSIRDILLQETFHETGPLRKRAVLAAHVLSKLPPPDKATEKKWLEQVKGAQKRTLRKDQIFIWIEASTGWTPFPSILSQGLKKTFNKDDFQNDAIYLIQKIKDPTAKNQLISDLLKAKNKLRPEYQKIVEERFKR